MPWYRNYGKIETPMSDQEFQGYMDGGKFTQSNHKGYIVCLYYTGIRKSEGLAITKKDIRFDDDFLYVDVNRLKGSRRTPALPLPLGSMFVDEVAKSYYDASNRLWPYSPRTGYNIVNRVIPGYPHLLRLSRITRFFLDGYTIPEVRSWTGLSLRALNYYVGIVGILRMGESMKVSIDPSIAESLV